MNNLFTLSNKCKVTLEDANWIIEEKVFFNTTCTKWRASIARRLADSATPELGYAKYIAIGDSNIPAQETDTTIWNEIQRQPIKTADTLLDENTVKVYARFPRWFSASVWEAGLFLDQTATGINGSWSLLAHSVFPLEIVKDTDNVLTIEWTVSIVNVVV